MSHSACFNLSPHSVLMDTTLTCLDWGNGLKIFFLPVLISHWGPPLSLGASISSGVRHIRGWQWDGWGVMAYLLLRKAINSFTPSKHLPFSHCLMKKKGAGGERGLKISVHSELGNLQNHSCPSQNRMCQLVCALTAVTDTSDVLRLSSEKQRIMHVVRSKRLVVSVK